jgi:hypothetical protein
MLTSVVLPCTDPCGQSLDHVRRHPGPGHEREHGGRDPLAPGQGEHRGVHCEEAGDLSGPGKLCGGFVLKERHLPGSWSEAWFECR